MLTADLVRASVRAGVLRPRFVDVGRADHLGQAEALVRLFAACRGKTVGELDEALADHIGDSTDFALIRGLAKLLRDGTEVAVDAAAEPAAIRAAVFRAAGASWPLRPGGGQGFGDRDAALAAAAEALGIDVEAVEDGLFGDLAAEQRVKDVALPEPEALLERYNLGLAQAILLRARAVVVELPGVSAARLRSVFRYIKFRRLMHRAAKTADGYRIELDGPLSLFRQTQRYGLQLAMVLPGLALAERWSLAAEVVWGKERRALRFELDQDAPIVSRDKDVGTWVGDEEKHLQKGFRALDSPWKLSRGARVVDLGGRDVLVPDYVLKHEDGREALLDIVWFWKKARFADRLALLREHGPKNLIVALATRYNGDKKDPPDVGDATCYPFKGVIAPKRLVELAEEVAVRGRAR